MCVKKETQGCIRTCIGHSKSHIASFINFLALAQLFSSSQTRLSAIEAKDSYKPLCFVSPHQQEALCLYIGWPPFWKSFLQTHTDTQFLVLRKNWKQVPSNSYQGKRNGTKNKTKGRKGGRDHKCWCIACALPACPFFS